METSIFVSRTVTFREPFIDKEGLEDSLYAFEGGYPTPDTVQRAYDDADLMRAVNAYKFFYPTVSGLAILKGNEQIGLADNKTFGMLDTTPQQLILTANSDTPYGPMMISLANGPMVVELPPGALIVMAMDINQRWIADMGIPGPDEGKGGKHLLLPPGYKDEIPEGYYAHRSTTNRLIIGARALPVRGDVDVAMALLPRIRAYPLHPRPQWKDPVWVNMTGRDQDTTPLQYETNLRFWETLHEAVNTEPPYEGYHHMYGDLAILGIAKGRPFIPDTRLRGILARAAEIANAQMRVEAFADRRPDRVVWPDRKWEWAALRFENGDFDTLGYADLDARDKWFYQAIGASPAMFRRQAGQGSLYWMSYRDKSGAYLDGDKSYKLIVPQPVPGKLFWSVTVYDAETRSQIRTAQNKAALRSLFELKDAAGDQSVDLYFGPRPPVAGKEGRWIRTIPEKGWFACFRIYGPEESAFKGSWKPGDLEKIS